MREFADIVRGKTVALVGNARSLLKQGKATEIDEHDVVIRINLGIPEYIGPKAGRKTTVLVSARSWKGRPVPESCLLGVFVKQTLLGDMEWPKFQKRMRPAPSIRWPVELYQEVVDFVGAPPGSGIMTLYWLKRHAEPASVSVYGMDFWKTGTTWKNDTRTWNHKPDAERTAFELLTQADTTDDDR